MSVLGSSDQALRRMSAGPTVQREPSHHLKHTLRSGRASGPHGTGEDGFGNACFEACPSRGHAAAAFAVDCLCA